MKKKPQTNENVAGAVASVAAPIFRGKSKTQKRVSEADITEQDLILGPMLAKRRKSGLVQRTDPDQAREMLIADLIQCQKNAEHLLNLIGHDESMAVEPWVQEKIIKSSDYLNTVAEYYEGQQSMKHHSEPRDSILTFESNIGRLNHALLQESTSIGGDAVLQFSEDEIIVRESEAKQITGLLENLTESEQLMVLSSPELFSVLVTEPDRLFEAISMVEAKKAKAPFAVGMAAAKKQAGITKTPAKDLPKSVVKKGHEIGKSIKKSQKGK
jgi:hypothetical protein